MVSSEAESWTIHTKVFIHVGVSKFPVLGLVLHYYSTLGYPTK